MNRRARLLTAAAAILFAAIGLAAGLSGDERPVVTEILPAADEVPENLLRFYVRFSQPMQRGDAVDQIQLLDQDGVRVEGPFLRIGEELWTPDMRTLTLLLDPGRIKRGVAPNLEAGGPLRAGRRYTLVVDARMTDDHHRSMAADHRKPFLVTAADREGPVPSRWRLELPASGSSGPLRVRFEAPVDPLVAERLIRVETDSGRPLPGTTTIGPQADRLEFVPAEPWQPGGYRLAVHPALEDASGNRVSAPFEMASGTVAGMGGSDEVLTIDFDL
jgi:hypothetical protein